MIYVTEIEPSHLTVDYLLSLPKGWFYVLTTQRQRVFASLTRGWYRVNSDPDKWYKA